MSITCGDLKKKIIRLIGDEIVGDGSGGAEIQTSDISPELLLDSVHAALTAVCSRFAKPMVVNSSDLTVDEDLLVYTLPEDLFDIEGVQELSTGEFLPQIPIVGGQTITMSLDQSRNSWLPYPSESVSFLVPLSDKGAKIYYSALWTLPELDSDLMEPPNRLNVALSFFGASYCLMKKATLSSNIRQFNTKVDSGQPDDNVLKDMSTYFLLRFDQELQRIPIQQKGQR